MRNSHDSCLPSLALLPLAPFIFSITCLTAVDYSAMLLQDSDEDMFLLRSPK
jgi:hypothetical protein